MGRNIFDEIGDQLGQEWEAAFGRTSAAFGMGSRGTYQLIEDKNSGISDLYVAVPGYADEDISVEMQGGKLTICGKCDGYGECSLVPARLELEFQISSSFLVESATLTKGLLIVRLKHQGAKPESVKIPVQSL